MLSLSAFDWLRNEVGVSESAARQIVEYLGGAKAAFGMLPTQQVLAMERFFDESGGMQLVIHSPNGSRLNRAWGLALRKRFCRSFNFELQAAATEDAIILSLSTSHSFPLDDVTRYLHSNTAREVLVQALLDAPMFGLRWRWNATTALALPRFIGGNKVPPQLQRMKSEDLLATVFPDQVACLENIVGERQIPDHPLVAQTLHDCLHEAMDIDGLEALLRRVESAEVRFVCRDLTAPSPLASEILSARPYAFLDDAPLEERRTQAVVSRRWLDPESASDIGRLDPEAIARVQEEAWPQAETADELHDALGWLGLLTTQEVARQPAWPALLAQLAQDKRVSRFAPEGRSADAGYYVAAERLPEFQAVHPNANLAPAIVAPPEYAKVWTREAALIEIVRGRLEGLGPVTARALAEAIAVPIGDVEAALVALDSEGFVMRGQFNAGAPETEWCERRLLARITRYTVKRLRQEIEPVSAADLMRFLLDWQRVTPDERMEGPDAVAAVVSQLEGFEAAAAAWETELLPARISGYEPEWLDDLCRAGRVVWTRLDAPRFEGSRAHGPSPVRSTPITLLSRRNMSVWTSLAKSANGQPLRISTRAQAVADYLAAHGASFFEDVAEGLDLPRTFVEDALRELTAAGLVNSDGFSGLRALLLPAERRKPISGGRRRRTAGFGVEDAGRWALIRRKPKPAEAAVTVARETAEQIARTLLKRYGVVFWRLLAREADWLPPWRELLMALRRMETRGEIRGGRFVTGFSGEQFALPEAISVLRSVRNAEKAGRVVAVSGADPLNLVGVVLPGPRVPGLYSNRVLYRDGVAISALISGEVQYFEKLEPEKAWEMRNVLLKTPAPAGLASLM